MTSAIKERISQHKLIRHAGPLWRQATEPAFLEALYKGELPERVFTRWLVQIHKLDVGLCSFKSFCLSNAPRRDWNLLIQGLQAIDDEMDWLDDYAVRRNIYFNIPSHSHCRRYIEFLLKCAYVESYPTLMAILFGTVAVRFGAWGRLKPKGPYELFIRHWSDPQFAEFVGKVGDVARQSTDRRDQEVFGEVLEFERDFWDIGHGG